MMRFLRYTLATVFFAAGVGCLALWWRSLGPPSSFRYKSATNEWGLLLTSGKGVAFVVPRVILPPMVQSGRIESDGTVASLFERDIRESRSGVFGRYGRGVYFPLWYPCLIFALAGVGVLQVGRFTIRSALIATTVVAGLLGMAVIL